MRTFFRNLLYRFGSHLTDIGSGWNVFWFGLSAALTYILVVSGGDWWWFVHLQSSVLSPVAFPAIVLGTFVPIAVLIGLVFRGHSLPSFAIGQATVMGWLVSSTLKIFTGRVHPEPALVNGPDISHVFRFGLFRGGIFWGWPSSHTTVAFAMAFALVALYPQNRTIRILALLYALYIGLGVSVTIHWLSDALAGAIIGAVIGLAIGTSFRAEPISSR